MFKMEKIIRFEFVQDNEVKIQIFIIPDGQMNKRIFFLFRFQKIQKISFFPYKNYFFNHSR